MNPDPEQRIQLLLAHSKREFTNHAVPPDKADELQAQLLQDGR